MEYGGAEGRVCGREGGARLRRGRGRSLVSGEEGEYGGVEGGVCGREGGARPRLGKGKVCGRRGWVRFGK